MAPIDEAPSLASGRSLVAWNSQCQGHADRTLPIAVPEWNLPQSRAKTLLWTVGIYNTIRSSKSRHVTGTEKISQARRETGELLACC